MLKSPGRTFFHHAGSENTEKYKKKKLTAKDSGILLMIKIRQVFNPEQLSIGYRKNHLYRIIWI